MSTMPLRVVLVDDHELVRNGIKSLLENEPDITVAGEAATMKDAIARVEWARPDVVIHGHPAAGWQWHRGYARDPRPNCRRRRS